MGSSGTEALNYGPRLSHLCCRGRVVRRVAYTLHKSESMSRRRFRSRQCSCARATLDASDGETWQPCTCISNGKSWNLESGSVCVRERWSSVSRIRNLATMCRWLRAGAHAPVSEQIFSVPFRYADVVVYYYVYT